MKNYSIEDALEGYRWRGHRSGEFTELSAVPKEYKQGKENYEWNCNHKAFPKTRFARTEQDVRNFVDRNYEGSLLMYGLNPRPRIIKNDKGYAKSALERDIENVQNWLLDFDFLEKNDSEGLRQSRKKFFYTELTAYFQDLDLMPPTFAFSGGGYHALCAHPPVSTKDYPDMSSRWKQFTEDLWSDYGDEIENLEMKMDKRFKLNGMVKMYGTRKPEEGAKMSRFLGGDRVEDEALLDLLLTMEVSPENKSYTGDSTGSSQFTIGNTVPDWFEQLLISDEVLRKYYEGTGKEEGTDTSGSGYDFAVMSRLRELGQTNQTIDDLATVIATRPNGSVQNSGKGHAYIARTIASALLK